MRVDIPRNSNQQTNQRKAYERLAPEGLKKQFNPTKKYCILIPKHLHSHYSLTFVNYFKKCFKKIFIVKNISY